MVGETMTRPNAGIDFELSLLENCNVNQAAIEEQVRRLCAKRTVKKEAQVASLLRAVTCIDLTSLCGDDCSSNIQRLCMKAANPIRHDLLQAIGISPEALQVGAVCVYPAKVPQCKKTLKAIGCTVPIAAVATGFPTGQYPLSTRLGEIEYAVAEGATEIDIVISRDQALCSEWQCMYDDVKAMKEACGKDVHLKTILAVGELGTFANIYKASMVCMMAGADFIKTSTGKESVNATLPVGVVMTRAIRDYHLHTGFHVGFKPAGGIRTAKDALLWQMLMYEELGSCWLFPNLFRFGASGLLGDIERQVFHYVTGCYASSRSFSYL